MCCGGDAIDEENLILCCALCCCNLSVYNDCDCFGCSGKVIDIDKLGTLCSFLQLLLILTNLFHMFTLSISTRLPHRQESAAAILSAAVKVGHHVWCLSFVAAAKWFATSAQFWTRSVTHVAWSFRLLYHAIQKFPWLFPLQAWQFFQHVGAVWWRRR